ncbi:Regulator of RpoS [uncultured archaeon]|nr:Regulator of RpoS [uncultured archaeon]
MTTLSSILIVNSEPDLAALYAEMLSMDTEKYIINMAHTGKECLLTLNRYIPDLILLDIELPDMDGWDLVEEIKKSGVDIPVIVIASKPPEAGDFSHLVMVSDYLMKPVTIDCLDMAVIDALKVPRILNNCIETIGKYACKEETRSLLERNIGLMKQSIADRKLFVLMRQVYPDKKIINDNETRLLLDDLKKRIETAHYELETFKIQGCLLHG